MLTLTCQADSLTIALESELPTVTALTKHACRYVPPDEVGRLHQHYLKRILKPACSPFMCTSYRNPPFL
jgi:hypothetical protein